MIDAQTLAQRYIASWNETDAATRRHLVDSLWTEDAHYADPMFKVDGPDAIAALIGGVHSKYPGHRFELTGSVDGHGPYIRFSWTLGPANGGAIAAGTDVATVAADGRLTQVTGFLDQLPTAA
jgi:hypothetical protein